MVNEVRKDTLQLKGRREIFTDVPEINAGNVIEVLQSALTVHNLNKEEIEYLWNYWKGDQPIMHKTKEVRDDINNKMVINHTEEIMQFFKGRILPQPCLYISRRKEGEGAEVIAAEINKFNDYMHMAGKRHSDTRLLEDMLYGGIGHRMVIYNKKQSVDEAPFKIIHMDSRATFIIKSSGIEHEPMMGVAVMRDKDGKEIYNCYTENAYYLVDNTMEKDAVKVDNNGYGMIPIFEYPLTYTRMGIFEFILSIQDGINGLASTRMDDIMQFVQAFMKFIGCDINEEKIKEFKKNKIICLPSGEKGENVDVDIVAKSLDQSGLQIFADTLYEDLLRIVHMPTTTKGGTSTSDTGLAVLHRDGWVQSDSKVVSVEDIITEYNRPFDKLVLKILRDSPVETKLTINDFELKFIRYASDNMLTKAETAVMLKTLGYSFQLAVSRTGLSNDPEGDYAKCKSLIDQAWSNTKDKTGGDPIDENAIKQTIADNGKA